jgi:hypothetical protein
MRLGRSIGSMRAGVDGCRIGAHRDGVRSPKEEWTMRAPLIILAVALGLGAAQIATAEAPKGRTAPRVGCFTQEAISGIAPAPGDAVYVRVNTREFHRAAVRGPCPNLRKPHWYKRAALFSGSGDWFCPGDTAYLYAPAAGHEDRCSVEIGPSLQAR